MATWNGNNPVHSDWANQVDAPAEGACTFGEISDIFRQIRRIVNQGNFKLTTVAASGAAISVDDNFLILSDLSIDYAVTLPQASTVSSTTTVKRYAFYNNAASNSVTITPYAGDSIEGASTKVIGPKEYVEIIANGSVWYPISDSVTYRIKDDDGTAFREASSAPAANEVPILDASGYLMLPSKIRLPIGDNLQMLGSGAGSATYYDIAAIQTLADVYLGNATGLLYDRNSGNKLLIADSSYYVPRGSMPIAATITVTGSAVSAQAITGLDMNTDGGMWELDVVWNQAVANKSLYLYINTDTTDANYISTMEYHGNNSGVSAPATISNYNLPILIHPISSTILPHGVFCNFKLFFNTGSDGNKYLHINGQSTTYLASNFYFHENTAYVKTVAETNITILRFQSSDTSSSIGTNSKFTLRRVY